jgi:hypothetical protein
MAESAASIISNFKSVFIRLGVPQEIISDNIHFGSHKYADVACK